MRTAMRRIKHWSAIVLAVALASVCAYAADEIDLIEKEGPLVIGDALALALVRSPELEAFSYEVRASEARELQAKRIPNPELDVRLYRPRTRRTRYRRLGL